MINIFKEKFVAERDFPILRVRKYAKFGVFYTKIVQMTPLRLRRESLPLQKFSVTNREPLPLQKFSVTNRELLPTPVIFCNKHSLVLTFFATNTI